jgi:hypothetical protein
LKRYFWFIGIFILAFSVLQFLSGMLMTMFYTPTEAWEAAGTLPSQIEFGHVSMVPPLVISLVALGITIGATNLIGKKVIK